MSKRNPEARAYNKRLTIDMLKEYGIWDICWDWENGEWWIDRYWYKNNSKNKVHKRVPIKVGKGPHKYVEAKGYPIITFSYKCKTISIPLGRVLCAWFRGEVPEGMEIDHIDNNPWNNKIGEVHGDKENNLDIVTPEYNKQKRFTDNPEGGVNQWSYINRNEQ